MATATALARARPAKTTCNPTPTSQIIGPEGPKHPGNRQLYDKRGCPDAGAPLCGNHADTKVATFCAALWLTFTLPLTFDAVKHLVLCQVEQRPPKLDLDIYPYLPKANVGTTSAASYMALMRGQAA